MAGRRAIAFLLITLGAARSGLAVRLIFGSMDPINDDSARVLRQLSIHAVAFSTLLIEYLIADWVFRKRNPKSSLLEWLRNTLRRQGR